ncbi:MAG: hypothetical protein ACFFA2_09720, partial [Promethearchaeota archaeon]
MKKKIFTIFILIFFVSLLSGLFSTQSLYTGEIFRNDDVLPKSNADEIVIHTPENRSYTSPMNGYYPATYGFENDDVGTNPAEWEVFEGAGYVDVIDEINNHQRVVELYDNDNTNHDELHISFSLQTYGTVEFWVMSNDVSDTFSIRLLDDTATSVWGDGIGWIQLYLDFVRYQDNTSTYYNVKPVSDNTWYHIKIEFECSTGNYQGLAQDTWRFYVDGEEFGDFGFLNDIENVSQLYFFTRGSDMDYRYYVDAVGFSWDEHYQIGDNLNEGLLLSFDTNFTPDWMGYSLDGAPNRTILGDATFPMPADGQHKIQVFGNDTLGTMYASIIRYFEIIYIAINTPRNRTYTTPMNGYYPATYGFENDDVGTNPAEWE